MPRSPEYCPRPLTGLNIISLVFVDKLCMNQSLGATPGFQRAPPLARYECTPVRVLYSYLSCLIPCRFSTWAAALGLHTVALRLHQVASRLHMVASPINRYAFPGRPCRPGRAAPAGLGLDDLDKTPSRMRLKAGFRLAPHTDSGVRFDALRPLKQRLRKPPATAKTVYHRFSGFNSMQLNTYKTLCHRIGRKRPIVSHAQPAFMRVGTFVMCVCVVYDVLDGVLPPFSARHTPFSCHGQGRKAYPIPDAAGELKKLQEISRIFRKFQIFSRNSTYYLKLQKITWNS